MSQTTASTLWPGDQALGKCVRLNADTMPCRVAVGIAEDIKSHQLANDPDMYHYVPARRFNSEQTSIFVRVYVDAANKPVEPTRSLRCK